MLFKVIPLFFFKYKVSKQSLNAYTMICGFFFSLVNLSTFQKQSTKNLRQGLLHLHVFIKLHVSYLKGNFCIWKVLLEQLILRRWTWRDLLNKWEAFFAASKGKGGCPATGGLNQSWFKLFLAKGHRVLCVTLPHWFPRVLADLLSYVVATQVSSCKSRNTSEK